MDNNEKLFWLIFKNKYLINKIFDHINNIEWVIYDDHLQLHINNRLKFKDTHSLGLMIKNKLFKLLNYKLNNNEYIEIDKESIGILFDQLSIDKNNNNNKITDKLKKILIKLLDNKRNEFEILDLTLEAVKYNSVEALRILVNQPYSIKINLSTLQYAVRYSLPLIVEELLKVISCNYNDDEIHQIKKELIKLEQYPKNKKIYKIYETILFKSTTTTTTTNLPILLWNNFENKKKVILIKDIDSSFIIISKYDVTYLSKQDLFSTYQMVYQDYTTNINDDLNLSLKQLVYLIIINIKKVDRCDTYIEFYKDYFLKYKETIKECYLNQFDDEDETTSTLTTTTTTTKVILSNFNENVLKYKEFFNISKLLESLIENDYSLENKNILIQNSIIKGHESIIEDCNNGSLVWNQILIDIILIDIERNDGTVVINDKSTIEWMLNCKNTSILIYLQNHIGCITFGTFELADYVYKESGLINHIFGSQVLLGYMNLDKFIYNHVWNEAIHQFDLNLIKYIESLNINIHEITKYTKSNIDQLYKFINYYNQSGFKEFDVSSISLFLDYVIKILNDNGCIGEIPNIKLNFDNKQFNCKFAPILTKSMDLMDLKKVELILNSNCCFLENYTQSMNENGDIIEFCHYFNHDVQKNIFNEFKVVFHYNEKKGATKIDIINLINNIICKRKLNHITTIMVNYFFEKLISIKGITFKEIDQVYQIIQQNSITIKENLYHTFYYLHAKDIRLTYYILNPYLCYFYFTNKYAYYYDLSYSDYGTDVVYLEDYIKSDQFTFKDIKNLKFEQLLEMLDNVLSPLMEQNYSKLRYITFKSCEHKKINWELQYYLIIRRVDLFFKKLQHLKYNLDFINNNNNNNNNTSNSLNLITSFLYDSPSTTLLSNSTLLENINNQDNLESSPPLVSSKFIENFQIYEFQPEEPSAFYFKFKKILLKYICKIMNLNEILKVIHFNYYQTSFLNNLLKQSIKCHRFDIVKLLLDNFNIIKPSSLKKSKKIFTPFIFENYFQLVQYPCTLKSIKTTGTKFDYQVLFKIKFLQSLEDQFKSKDTLYKQFISPSIKNEKKLDILLKLYNRIKANTKKTQLIMSKNRNNELIEIFKKDEYQELFKKLFQEKEKKLNCSITESGHCNCNYNLFESNIFLSAFCKGDIKLCEFILSRYHSIYQFKITNQSITTTIKNNNIHIINYFIKNHNNMWNSDLNLYLKSQLNNS